MANRTFMSPVFRLSYPFIFAKNKNDKYSISMIFDKDLIRNDKSYKAKYLDLKTEIERVGKAAFPDGKAKRLSPLKDGDTERPDDPVYKNSIFCEATTQFEPQILDHNRSEVISRDDVYAGCYCRARVHVFSWDINGGGVSVGFDAIQKVKDGEKISTKPDAKDFFDDDEDISDEAEDSTDDMLI